MPTEYDLTDDLNTLTFTLSWDMWWGENGDHWRLMKIQIIYMRTL